MNAAELTYRQASRLNGSFVYGFPLDTRGVIRCGDKISPIPSDMTGKEREWASNGQINRVFDHIIGLCNPLWPNKLKIQCGYTKGKHYNLLALVASTGRNDEIIPQGETLQKLTNIMVGEGFKGKPRWFVLT